LVIFSYSVSAIKTSLYNQADTEKVMTTQNQVQTTNTEINGVNVDHVMNLIGGIEEDNERSKFQFRLDNKWVDGGQNRSSIQGYYADGREDDTRLKPFIVDADEPAVSAGSDSAPNPMEFVLHSLASCMTSTMIYHAAVQGVKINSVESTLTGDMDVRGMLGLSEEVRKGYDHVQVSMLVESAESADSLKKLALFSPVYDIVSKSVSVEFVLETR
jgi:uncharacterized OsmC-like protein